MLSREFFLVSESTKALDELGAAEFAVDNERGGGLGESFSLAFFPCFLSFHDVMLRCAGADRRKVSAARLYVSGE